MYKNVTRKEIKEIEVVYGEALYCDNCGKLIYAKDASKPKSGYIDVISYWNITTGHKDWGNDSIDSIENFNVCSVECLQKYVDKYKERSKVKINTEYINIEKDHIPLCESQKVDSIEE